MARVQIGKKQRVEQTEYKESTKRIARETLNSIVEEGFNGADVLPDIWVLEKTLRNHIEDSQPNIAPEISDAEIEDLSDSMLSSLKQKTDKSSERLSNVESYENKLDFPKELPTIKMGSVTVVQFPEGGSDKQAFMKVEGYKKVGQFYRKKIESEQLGKQKGRTRIQLQQLKKEKELNLRRIKIRRGLLKPVPKKAFNGAPHPSPVSPNDMIPGGIATATPKNVVPMVKQVEIAKQKIQDGIAREKSKQENRDKLLAQVRSEEKRRDENYIQQLEKMQLNIMRTQGVGADEAIKLMQGKPSQLGK
jgi:hypothetical protein|tara:strand:- start:280 stop:1194 length:915 start_codon:yes stop_codon:yes gene_type:complete